MEAPPAVGTAAQGAEAGDEEAPVWRLASGSSASDDEASRIFFFFLSSAHATLILEAPEFPLWLHHIWALAPTSAMKAASPLAWSSFTTPDAPGAAKRMQRRLQVAVPMVFFTCLVQRGAPLVPLRLIRSWVFTAGIVATLRTEGSEHVSGLAGKIWGRGGGSSHET